MISEKHEDAAMKPTLVYGQISPQRQHYLATRHEIRRRHFPFLLGYKPRMMNNLGDGPQFF